jgi:predicted  nucleic acid-binding Zn-ribbon protein
MTEIRSAAAPYMDICEHLSRELHVTKTALTESETTEHRLRDKIARLREENEKLRAALKDIAKQHIGSENEFPDELLDFKEGYEGCVRRARAAALEYKDCSPCLKT